MPNIVFEAGGNATYVTTTNRITLGPGPNSIFDADGSALIITDDPDDYVTNASGNSGNRSACGVILPAGASSGVRPVVVNTSYSWVTFDYCLNLCGAENIDPSLIGPVRSWQNLTLTHKGVLISFTDKNGNTASYSGQPYQVCISYSADEAAAAGGREHFKVAYWASKVKDISGVKGRWYVLNTAYTPSNEACALLRLPASFALVQ